MKHCGIKVYEMFKYIRKDISKRLNPMEVRIYLLKDKYEKKQRTEACKIIEEIMENINNLRYANDINEFCLYPEVLNNLIVKLYELQMNQVEEIIKEYSKQSFIKIITKILLFNKYVAERSMKEEIESISLLCDEIRDIVRPYSTETKQEAIQEDCQMDEGSNPTPNN